MQTGARVPLVLSVAIVGLAGLVGKQQMYDTYRRHTQAARQDIAGLEEQAVIRQEIAVKEAHVTEQLGQLPSEVSHDWMVARLAALAGQAGLTFDSIRPLEPQVTNNLTRISVQLSFKATYHQVGEFISRVEHSTPFMAVEKLDLVKIEQGNRGEQEPVRATVRVTVFSIVPHEML